MSFGAAFALLEEVQLLVNCMRISFCELGYILNGIF
jgi:hypothetical protein